MAKLTQRHLSIPQCSPQLSAKSSLKLMLTRPQNRLYDRSGSPVTLLNPFPILHSCSNWVPNQSIEQHNRTSTLSFQELGKNWLDAVTALEVYQRTYPDAGRTDPQLVEKQKKVTEERLAM